jgi:hypothetical protein
MIDNRSVCFKRSLIWDIFIVFLTIVSVLKKFFELLGQYTWNTLFKSKLMRMYNEKRMLDRVQPQQSEIALYACSDSNHNVICSGPILDINERYLKFQTRQALGSKQFCCRLTRKFSRPWYKKKKTTYCQGKLYKVLSPVDKGGPYTYLIEIEPQSEFYAYMLDQYFLGKSMMRYIL